MFGTKQTTRGSDQVFKDGTSNTSLGLKNSEYYLASSEQIHKGDGSQPRHSKISKDNSKELSQIQNWVQNQENEMMNEFRAGQNLDAKNQTTSANFSFKTKSGKISLIENKSLKSTPSRSSMKFTRVLNQKLPEMDPSELIKHHIAENTMDQSRESLEVTHP